MENTHLTLTGRVALITGSSKGIGKAIAQSLAQEGADVVLTARDPVVLEATVQEFERLPGKAFAVAADATDPQSVQRVVGDAIQRFGRLDILVNNVGGVNKITKFYDLNRDDWISAFDLNVMTVVHFVQQALPWLKKSKVGRIINIASISGVEPGLLIPHYCASKAAVINLSKHLANLLGSDGVLVNVICVGQVHSDGRDQLAKQVAYEEEISLINARIKIDAQGAARIPLGRIGQGDDVAGLVTFLASDKSAWITGSCFHVNGGKHRSAF
ncbi:MAG: SDR family oxidoreductase [Chlamydiae bacterium]|nr:SDR family oxidoreductase [Chlamydiota bacterium]MBI3276251.1 SDR family oxidoreductase [Chlamydiota bacterium]